MTILLAILMAPFASWRSVAWWSRTTGPETSESCTALFKALVWTVVAVYCILISWKNWGAV